MEIVVSLHRTGNTRTIKLGHAFRIAGV